MSNTTTTEVQKIDVTEIASTMQGAGEVLSKNENLALKAVTGAEQLLDTIEAEGMSDELDAALNSWQVKAKEAVGIMNKRRSPITQIMTKMAKYFTEQEAKLDPAKADSVYAKIQLKRNAWARQKADEAKKKEQEILRQQSIAKERVSFKADVESHIRRIYGEKLFAFKQFAVKIYNSLTLENAAEVKKSIGAVKISYPLDKFNEIEPAGAFAVHLSAEDQKQIIVEVRDALYDELAANFRENMEAEKERLLDLIPSRLNELKEIAKAGEEQKKRLEEEAERRRVADEARQKQEAAEQAKRDQENIAAKTQLETATTLFDTAAQMAEIKNDSPARVREGYKIIVHNAAGWGAVFMMYFENEGQKLDVETMGKKTMNQMKAFAEKHAHKTGTFIVSDHLFYEEEFKAVATKS
jgi:hypothetical protein